MRVLIFSLAYPPFVGGAELAVKEITDRLPHITFDVVTVNLDGKQKPIETFGAVTVYRVGRGRLGKYRFPWSAVKKAQALHQEHAYDFAWAIMANQAGLAARRFSKITNLKYILTLQEGDSLRAIWARTWWMRRAYKAIYRQASHIQAISHYLAKRALKYGYKGTLSVVPNGVSIDHFCQSVDAAMVASLRARLGLRDQAVVITTSRLVRKNGIDTLIRSIKDLPVQLVIAGCGKLESNLRALAGELGMGDRVFFVGQISHEDLPTYLHLADVFVRASRSEGLGTSFLEAMAAGLPIIATPVGGIPDFLIDGQNGLFCAVNNPKDLAEKIEHLLQDKNLAERLAASGKQLVVDRYAWDHVVNEMKVIFDTVYESAHRG